MAHYAFLDENNIVTQVIVGNDESFGVDWETHYGEVLGQVCKRTSYNTLAGVHLRGEAPFRKNFAGVGYSYNEALNAFISPKPYESWILDENTCGWEAPVPLPEFNSVTQTISWDEENQTWIVTTIV